MNNDPLGESSTATAMKCLLVMFAFLALMASPLIKGTIDSELQLMSASINGVAAGATSDEFNPRRDYHNNF